MARCLPVMLIACALPTVRADAMQPGLVCMAPTRPADAGLPFSRLTEIEFYVDSGNPLTAYTVPFVRLTSAPDDAGHTVNAYGIAGANTAAADIVFAGNFPLTFTLAEIGKKLMTLAVEAEETAAMTDAIPGIACWRVEAEALP
jgi:hypothetical protein